MGVGLLPLTIITGFLGAGKTTLINRLLTGGHGRRLAVLVNEFGEIDIDSRFIADGAPKDVMQLTNGCVCCDVQDDLVVGLGSLLEKRDSGDLDFDQIVLETTGLADPGPVVQTVRRVPLLRERLGLDGIVTMFDARYGLSKLEEFEEAQRQVGLADLVLINKTDLISEEALADAEDRLRGINGTVDLLQCDHAAVDASHVLDIRTLAAGRITTPIGHHHNHDHHTHTAVSTFSVVIEAPLDLVRLQDAFSFLIMRYAERLLRYKGVLNVAGKDDQIAFQGLHDLFETQPLGPWPSGAQRRSEMVFIGSNLPEDEIRRDLQATVSN